MLRNLGLLLCTAGLLAACGPQPDVQASQNGANQTGAEGTASALPAGYMDAQFWRPKPAGPPPGQDVIVFNDANIFNELVPAIPANAENQKMFRNLVNYTTSAARGSSTEVWIDRGHGGNYCKGECTDSGLTSFLSAVTSAGYTPVLKHTAVGDLATLPASVKVLVLFMPVTPYSKAEINAMKLFASEGGRIVFIGEWDGFYGAAGIANENQFLLDMGAVMKNVGSAVDCGQTTVASTSLRPTQVTTGLNSLQMACSSVIQPGPQDYIFMFDKTNKIALAGVARIDTTPLP